MTCKNKSSLCRLPTHLPNQPPESGARHAPLIYNLDLVLSSTFPYCQPVRRPIESYYMYWDTANCSENCVSFSAMCPRGFFLSGSRAPCCIRSVLRSFSYPSMGALEYTSNARRESGSRSPRCLWRSWRKDEYKYSCLIGAIDWTQCQPANVKAGPMRRIILSIPAIHHERRSASGFLTYSCQSPPYYGPSSLYTVENSANISSQVYDTFGIEGRSHLRSVSCYGTLQRVLYST